MAQNKLEEQLRKELEARRISPSSKSWEVLSGRLDQADNKKRKRIMLWMGAAAVVMVLLLAGGMWSSTELTTPKVVDAPVKKSQDTRGKAKIETEHSRVPLELIKNNSLEAGKITIGKVSENLHPVASGLASRGVTSGSLEFSRDTIKVNPVAVESGLTKKDPIFSDSPKIQDKIEEVIRSLDKHPEKSTINDAEVNALLLAAASELEKDLRQEYFKKQYHAEALLAEVEGEMDRSFRDKLFDLLKEGYSKARNAVALD